MPFDSLEPVLRRSDLHGGGAKVFAYLAAEEDAEPFEQKMNRLVAQLREQQAEARRLDAAIEVNLETLGYAMNELARLRQ